ncbi:MAG TPA: hypothetical protein DIT07_09790 [Sphingobacteriaceae bacterium]|nr:hypothetical protein [Sphingobacteriaceae bacterium]
MITIAEDYFSFYETFKSKYSVILKNKNIGILSEFLDNKNHIIEFHKRYVQSNSPKVVICGINPGRFGAGKTGIPFIDFNSLSQMLPNIEKKEAEKSAKFFFSIVQEFGVDTFYQKFHVTNMSWYGFYHLKTRKNINYNNLPTEIQNLLIDKFLEEMRFINPDVIIPVGDIVNWELLCNPNVKSRLTAKIAPRLYHPAYRLVDKKTYMKTLTEYLSN